MKDKIEKLQQLAELYKDGILTKEELEEEKRKILADKPAEASQSPNIPTPPPFPPRPSQSDPNDNHSITDGQKPKLTQNKKRLIYIAASIIVLIGIGVFVGLYQHHQAVVAQEREQARLDSIAEVERRIIAQQREDSIRHDAEMRNFTTPDLALYGLHGHVKSLKILKGKNYVPYALTSPSVDFTYDGKLTSNNPIKDYFQKNFDLNPSTLKIKKNNDGFIIQVTDGTEWEQVSFEWDRHKLISFKDESGDCSMTWEYKYGANIVSEINFQGACIGSLHQRDSRYTNYQYDKYDNWISCEYYQTGFNDEYYDDGYEEFLTSHVVIPPKSGKILREIEYYE